MVYLYKKRPVFQQDFNILYVCAMQYSGIISVISKYLKYLAVDRTTLMFEAIILNEKCTKTLCDSLNAVVIPNSVSKWNAELSVFTFSMHRVDAQYIEYEFPLLKSNLYKNPACLLCFITTFFFYFYKTVSKPLPIF